VQVRAFLFILVSILIVSMKKTLLSVALLIQSSLLFGQMVLTTQKNDFTPINCFLKLTDSLENGIQPSAALWREYFSIPVVQLFSQAPGYDSARFVADMKYVFSHKDTAASNEEQRLMFAYKKNKALIRTTIRQMQTEHSTDDAIKALLYPYLPKSLQVDSIFPKQIYLFLDEGNGGFPGYVFNSMLQTAQVYTFKAGIISAHESYHSLVGGLFMVQLESSASFTDGEKGLLSFMEQIAEEGIADLIDKPILSRTNSPLYTQVKALEQNEDQLSNKYLKKMDSLFTVISQTGNVPPFDFGAFTKNGGHIPGRYMAQRIKQASLLTPCIQEAGNPVVFFEQYQAAAKLKGGFAFSTAAIACLKSLKAKYSK
jgi:hypothetical protein